jgi:hypothetical protein
MTVSIGIQSFGKLIRHSRITVCVLNHIFAESNSVVDNLIVRNREILRLDTARSQTVSSLQNWTAGTTCIARAETAYLKHPQDLFSIVSADDAVVTWLETLVECVLIRLGRLFSVVQCLCSIKAESC